MHMYMYMYMYMLLYMCMYAAVLDSAKETSFTISLPHDFVHVHTSHIHHSPMSSSFLEAASERSTKSARAEPRPARVAVVGCGGWTQGWCAAMSAP